MSTIKSAMTEISLTKSGDRGYFNQSVGRHQSGDKDCGAGRTHIAKHFAPYFYAGCSIFIRGGYDHVSVESDDVLHGRPCRLERGLQVQIGLANLSAEIDGAMIFDLVIRTGADDVSIAVGWYLPSDKDQLPRRHFDNVRVG